MKATAFAVFCVLALAGAHALSQADVDNFLETSELQAVENNRALLAEGTPGSYGGYGTEAAVATTVAAAPSCASGKSVAYTTSATKMCVLTEFKATTGTVYNAYNGRIADSTGVTCYVSACAAPAATAAVATATVAPAATTTVAVAAPAVATAAPAVTATAIPAVTIPTVTVPTVTVPTVSVPTVSMPTFSFPTINLGSLFGKGRKLQGAQFFWPFGPHPLMGGSAPATTTATTTTVVTNVTGRKISYFAAQCYTTCE